MVKEEKCTSTADILLQIIKHRQRLDVGVIAFDVVTLSFVSRVSTVVNSDELLRQAHQLQWMHKISCVFNGFKWYACRLIDSQQAMNSIDTQRSLSETHRV